MFKKDNDDNHDQENEEDQLLGDDNDVIGQDEPVQSSHSKMWYFLGGFTVILIAGLIIGGIVFGKINTDSVKKEQSSVSNSLSKGSASDTSSSASTTDYLGGMGIPSYYQQSSTKISDADRKTANAAADAAMPENASSALLSKATDSNLTDDTSKAELSDGTTNPEYSFLTAENVTEQVRDDMERIVNPIYGDWTALQSKYRIGDHDSTLPSPLNSFTNMFADDRVNAIATQDENTAKSIIPLEADWAKDDFGGKTTNSPYPWAIGVISDITCNYDIKAVSGDSITCSTPVTYTFIKSDGSKATEQKHLTIRYVPNYNHASASSRRILIDTVQQQ